MLTRDHFDEGVVDMLLGLSQDDAFNVLTVSLAAAGLLTRTRLAASPVHVHGCAHCETHCQTGAAPGLPTCSYLECVHMMVQQGCWRLVPCRDFIARHAACKAGLGRDAGVLMHAHAAKHMYASVHFCQWHWYGAACIALA